MPEFRPSPRRLIRRPNAGAGSLSIKRLEGETLTLMVGRTVLATVKVLTADEGLARLEVRSDRSVTISRPPEPKRPPGRNPGRNVA